MPHAILDGGLRDAVGRVVKLEGAAAVRGSVVRRAVREQAVEKEQAARLHRRGHGMRAEDDLVANLPVAAFEMHDGAFAVPSGEELHAVVFDRGLVERDPDADDGRAERVVEVGVILVPWFFAAKARRWACVRRASMALLYCLKTASSGAGLKVVDEFDWHRVVHIMGCAFVDYRRVGYKQLQYVRARLTSIDLGVGRCHVR